MTGEPTGRGRVLTWLAARSVRQLALLAGAVVLLVSGLFGGLDRATPDAAPRLVADRQHLSEPLRITVKAVHWTDDLGEVLGPSEVGRYLLVIADVSTDQDRSVPAFVVKEALRLEGLDGFAADQTASRLVASQDAEPQVVVTADRVRLDDVGPGLTYEVAYIWQQRLSEPLPTSVTLTTYAHTFRTSSLDDQQGWFDRAADAVGRFPVTKLADG